MRSMPWMLGGTVVWALLVGCAGARGGPDGGEPAIGEQECRARAGWQWRDGQCIESGGPTSCPEGAAPFDGVCEPAFQRASLPRGVDGGVEAFSVVAEGQKTLYALPTPSISTRNGAPLVGFVELSHGRGSASVQYLFGLPPEVARSFRTHARDNGWTFSFPVVDTELLRVLASGESFSGGSGRVRFSYGGMGRSLSVTLDLTQPETERWREALADGSATPEDMMAARMTFRMGTHAVERTVPLRIACVRRGVGGDMTAVTDRPECAEVWRTE